MNSITELLNLEDSDILISDICIKGTTKTLTLETRPYAHYCPSYGYRMYSRGIKKRTIKHPILQDGYELILILKQRRWTCTNPECKYNISDSFHVIQWIIRMIDDYIRQLLQKFRQSDRELEEQLSYDEQRPVSLPPSDEVYLLQKYRWFILSNQTNTKYHSDPRMDLTSVV